MVRFGLFESGRFWLITMCASDRACLLATQGVCWLLLGFSASRMSTILVASVEFLYRTLHPSHRDIPTQILIRASTGLCEHATKLSKPATVEHYASGISSERTWRMSPAQPMLFVIILILHLLSSFSSSFLFLLFFGAFPKASISALSESVVHRLTPPLHLLYTTS